MSLQAIVNLYSEVAHAKQDGAYDKHGNLVAIDEAKVKVEQERLQAAYNAQAYARSRQAEYPPLAEQLDHIYHNGIASWKANVVKPVKDKYPKPG